MLTANNIVHHELIGLYVKVVYNSQTLCGVVIDETKNTVKIEVKTEKGKSEKLISKNNSVFQFRLPDGKWVEIKGNILSIRPEDRIKKRFKKI